MEPRITLVSLGVRDLSRARAFYEALGWTGAVQPDGEVAFFQAGGMVLGLWQRERLVADAGLPDDGGFGAVTLAHNAAPQHLTLGTQVFGVGLGVTAYVLGTRHAFDADHIAAIDNTTRKLMSDGQRPVAVGFWFALGHSSLGGRAQPRLAPGPGRHREPYKPLTPPPPASQRAAVAWWPCCRTWPPISSSVPSSPFSVALRWR